MFDESTLSPINQYKLNEKRVLHHFTDKVHILVDTNNSYRFCFIGGGGVYCSCLIVGADKIIHSVYTLPEYRRRGIAKQLLLIARLTLKTVAHSDNLTIKGGLWRDSVEK